MPICANVHAHLTYLSLFFFRLAVYVEWCFSNFPWCQLATNSAALIADCFCQQMIYSTPRVDLFCARSVLVLRALSVFICFARSVSVELFCALLFCRHKRPTTIGQKLTNYKDLALNKTRKQAKGGSRPCEHCALCSRHIA